MYSKKNNIMACVLCKVRNLAQSRRMQECVLDGILTWACNFQNVGLYTKKSILSMILDALPKRTDKCF